MSRSSALRVSCHPVPYLFAALVLLLSGTAFATPCGEWLVPEPTGNNVENPRSSTYYPTLGAAVAAAQAGDTLVVKAPALVVGGVTIDKNLTLEGSSTSTTTLTPGIDTCGQGSGRGWFRVAPGVDLKVSNLSFDGSGRQIYEAFRHQGKGSFETVTFSNIAYQQSGPAYQGTAIAIFTGGGNIPQVNVTNATFTSIGRTGVLYYGALGTVDTMTYTGKGPGNWLDYGVDVEAGAEITVENSTITSCLGSAEGASSAGVQISTFEGPYSGVTLTDNQITGNTLGIAAGYGGGSKTDTSVVVAHGNTITGNHQGLVAETDKPINATGNHWGCSLGPGFPGCDSVTGPYASQVTTGYPVISQLLGASGSGGHPLTQPRGATVLGAQGPPILVVGQDSDNVFRIDPNGTVTQILDASGDGQGNTLSQPMAALVAPYSNDIYVTGYGSNNVFKIDSGGTVSQVLDASGDGRGNTLSEPWGLAYAWGNVYVVGSGSNNVFEIDQYGRISQVLDSSGDGHGNTLSDPRGIAADNANQIYVAGYGSDNVFQVRPDGTVTEIMSSAGDGHGNGLQQPLAVAVDQQFAIVYVAGFGSNNVLGTSIGYWHPYEIIDASGDGQGNTLSNPTSIAVDRVSHSVYVAGSGSDNVLRWTYASSTTPSKVTEILGSLGDNKGHPLASPCSVAVSPAVSPTKVYVTGCDSNNVFEMVWPPGS